MTRNKLELYLHIPFCERKCGYCDFLSAPADSEVIEAYVEALLEEIAYQSKFYQGYQVPTLFFGGGTPSLLSDEQVKRLMDSLRSHFAIMEDAEITIEANPGTLDLEKATAYFQAGINRISLGLQSMDNEELLLLGRIHTWEDFLLSYSLAREAGFQNLNVDLMFGLPGQTIDSWERSLRQVAELEPEHISAYNLILEEGTPFFERYQEKDLPGEETDREMYALRSKRLEHYGYQQYEISNFAKLGRECRHNKGYWTRENYLGLGLGSASMVENQRFSNATNLAAYLVQKGKCPAVEKENFHMVGRQKQMEEHMFLGLRLTGGISEKEFAKTFGSSLMEIYGAVILPLLEEGLLKRSDGRFFLTKEGFFLSNYVMAQFIDL